MVEKREHYRLSKGMRSHIRRIKADEARVPSITPQEQLTVPLTEESSDSVDRRQRAEAKRERRRQRESMGLDTSPAFQSEEQDLYERIMWLERRCMAWESGYSWSESELPKSWEGYAEEKVEMYWLWWKVGTYGLTAREHQGLLMKFLKEAEVSGNVLYLAELLEDGNRGPTTRMDLIRDKALTPTEVEVYNHKLAFENPQSRRIL